jgi:hypothetical protein
MVSMIDPSQNDHILEPCGGDGMFIDALLQYRPNLKIDTCDLDATAVSIMKSKYSSISNVSIRETDTLTDSFFDNVSQFGYYDKIIGNPPYGGWQEYDRRAELKQKYDGFYVRETYSLFLLRCVTLLKAGGVLSFIIPDTFLFLHNHKKLRKYLLENTLIKEIAIFPSKFFPGVSFGYSNLCIITIHKTGFMEYWYNNRITVLKGLKTDEDLLSLSVESRPSHLSTKHLIQGDVFDNQDHVFLINDHETNKKIVECKNTLADIADCVTGIYCGNNKRFMALAKMNYKKSLADYPYIAESEIDYSHNSNEPVSGSKKYIPIVKGSSSSGYYRTDDEWLIDWTYSALLHYKNDKKARFQNSQYYFRKGIALPMVKSSKIKATLLPAMVFDQSIVGVFPHDDKYLPYVLAYLNSKIANEFIHTINPTANNSANYLKKMPFYIPTEEELQTINELVNSIIETRNVDRYQYEVDKFFEERM